MADPWLPERLRVFTDLVKAEGGLFQAIKKLLKAWAAKIKNAVFGSAVPDPFGVTSSNTWFADQVDDLIEVEIRGIFDYASDMGPEDDWEPDALARVREFVQQFRNRLVRVPDSVFASVQRATLKATTEGWSIDDLEERIQEILGETGSEDWDGRARAIARTEAIAAYNGGRFNGFVSQAAQLGGAWDKIWLATHDHRTRFTHARKTGADEQRVPLLSPFAVGESLLMYPGDPTGPPGEVINCRCSILLARAGEKVDLSNRHFRGLS